MEFLINSKYITCILQKLSKTLFLSPVKQTSLKLPDEDKTREQPPNLTLENNGFNLVYSDVQRYSQSSRFDWVQFVKIP